MSNVRVYGKISEGEHKQLKKLIREGKYKDEDDLVCIAVRKLIIEEIGGLDQGTLELIRKTFRVE